MARKLNKHFLLIVSLCLLGAVALGGGVYVYKKKHKDPHKLLAIAQQSEQKGDYVVAAQHYAGAGQLMHDPKLLTKAGDLLYAHGYDADDNVENGRRMWETAITTDPMYAPALERMLDCWMTWRKLPGGQTPALYDRIQQTAKKLLAADPKNLNARLAIPITTIDSWANQIENDQTKVDKAVKDLADLQSEAPDNADIPYYIGVAYATQGNRAQINGNTVEADKFFARADATIDAALKTNENNGKLHLRAAQLSTRQFTPPGDEDRLLTKLDRARTQAQKALALLKPTDPDYDEAVILAGSLARDPRSLKEDPKGKSRNVELFALDAAAQEKVYRDAIKAKPDDIMLRVRLAELIGSRSAPHRDEAIELLAKLPEPSADERIGPGGLNLKNVQLQALSVLTNLRLDKLTTLRTKAEQDAMLPQIEADYHKLELRNAENPNVLRLKAKLELAKGNITDAVTTLSQAVVKTDARNPLRYELMYLSAKCFLATNQPGSAKAYLKDIIDKYPNNDEARILLTETQLKEFKLDDAKKNLEVLEKPDHSPGDMRVVRMHIAALQLDKKTDEAKKVYARLPETNRNQKLDKATIAFLMQQPDEAKRLLEAVTAADPGDVDAALMLADFYNQKKDGANAAAALDRALKVHPDSAQLQIARAQVSGSSPEQLQQIRIKEAEKISDPLERELALLDLTRNEADENIPLTHLKAAEKINPNDPRVINAMFEYQMSKRNWDAAAPYLERLAQMNADKVKGTLLRWKMAVAKATAETDNARRTAGLVKALDLATQLTHDYPDFAQSWLSLGQTNEMLTHYEDAIPNFTTALKAQPQNADAYRGLIDCYYQLKRPDDAGKTIDQAVTVLPGSNMFKEMKLQHELTYGDPTKVVAEREQAVKNNDSVQSRMQLAQAYAAVARAKSAKPETEKEATQWLEKSKAMLAQGAEKFPNELQFTATHGSICLMLNQFDQGEKLWKTTMSKEPWKDNADATAAFAEFYLRASKPDQAIKLYRDFLATAAGKDNFEIASRLVDVLASQNKYDDAMAVLNSLPDSSQVQVRRVNLLVNQGKFADAEKLMNSLMQQQKTPELMSAMAFIYLNSDRASQALDLLNQALSQKPGMSNALYFRAMAYMRQPEPRIDDAISDLVQVRDSAPQNLPARYMLADCLLKTNDADSAMKELEGILRVAPAQKAARIRLIDLYSSQTPPRWLDAERVAREGDAQPELAADVDFLSAQARLWSKHNDPDRAISFIKRAMQAQPQNVALLHTYYGILVSGKRYQDLVAETDKLGKEKDLWWVHAMRGTAKCKLGDKDGGLQEFVAALDATLSAKDEAAGRQVIDGMSDAAGADAALKVVAKLPNASEPQWEMVTAWLQQKKGDVAGARKTIELILSNLSKLSVEQQTVALGFAGGVYMQTPDPNFERARDIYLQLLKLTPNDYTVYNNLACNRAVSAPDALQYAKKAYELSTARHIFEPLVMDTYGWALIQSGDERNLDVGLNVLLDGWRARHVVDIAYHLGEAYLRKNDAADADTYLAQAQTLYNEALANKEQVDLTLQQSIVDAQSRVAKLKNKR